MVKETKEQRKNYGILCHLFIDGGAVCYTDFWSAYDEVIPTKRHKSVGKETGLTNHIVISVEIETSVSCHERISAEKVFHSYLK